MRKPFTLSSLMLLVVTSSGIMSLASCSGLRKGAISITDKNFSVEYFPSYEGYLVTDYRGDDDTLQLPNEVQDEHGEYHPIVGIHDDAFFGRDKLIGVILGENIVHMGTKAFEGSSVENLTVNKKLHDFDVTILDNSKILLNEKNGGRYLPGPNGDYDYLVGVNSSSGAFSVETTCRAIGTNVFKNRTGNVTIYPGALKVLSEGAFMGVKLVSSSSGAKLNLDYVGPNALNGTTGLTEITVESENEEIGTGAFVGCDATSITVGTKAKAIASGVFASCANLRSLTLPFPTPGTQDMTGGGSEGNTFHGFFGKTSFTNSYEANKYYLPNSLGTVNITTFGRHGAGLFKQCKKITKITMPEDQTLIATGDYSYSGLNSWPFTKKTNTISKEAFYYNGNSTSLTTLRIPDSVRTIGDQAFARIFCLTKVYIPKTVTTMGMDVFDDCGSYPNGSSLHIYCEASSAPEGWNAAWGNGGHNVYITWGETMPKA